MKRSRRASAKAAANDDDDDGSDQDTTTTTTAPPANGTVNAPRKRGRPRKQPKVEPKEEERDDSDDDANDNSAGSGGDDDAGDDDGSAGGSAGNGNGAAAYEPVTDGSEITFELRKLNSHLVCSLCKGYLRDAHSIMECLHTFCKVCLYQYYRSRAIDSDSDCPKCHIPLMSTDPMRNRVRFDRVLQNLVDKILPDFAAKDELLKRQIAGTATAAAPDATPAPNATATATAAAPATATAASTAATASSSSSASGSATAHAAGTAAGSSADAPSAASAGGGSGESGSASGSGGGSGNPYSPLPASSSSNERLSPLNLPAAAPAGGGAAPPAIALTSPASPELLLELRPHPSDKALASSALAKPFVRTSVKSTIKQLRRYISATLKLGFEVEVLCATELLGADHTLEFIKKTRWHHSVVSHGARHLLFTYRTPAAAPTAAAATKK